MKAVYIEQTGGIDALKYGDRPKPEAAAGQVVEVTVTVPDPAPADKPAMGIYDLIKSFPPGPRSAESWEEIERQFREERDSWDR